MITPELSRDPENLERDPITVRRLQPDDLDWVVRIDAEHSGRSRREYYRLKLAESEADTGVRISLAAVVEGEPAGFLTGRLYYGEFGQPEPIAILDSIGVSQARSGQHVASALMQQLETNLAALGIERLQTQVDWHQIDLLRFFQRSGFEPAPRLCLEKPIARGRS
jgi:ribosomal protein S18 acetylase RimI-like enzyme